MIEEVSLEDGIEEESVPAEQSTAVPAVLSPKQTQTTPEKIDTQTSTILQFESQKFSQVPSIVMETPAERPKESKPGPVKADKQGVWFGVCRAQLRIADAEITTLTEACLLCEQNATSMTQDTNGYDIKRLSFDSVSSPRRCQVWEAAIEQAANKVLMNTKGKWKVLKRDPGWTAENKEDRFIHFHPNCNLRQPAHIDTIGTQDWSAQSLGPFVNAFVSLTDGYEVLVDGNALEEVESIAATTSRGSESILAARLQRRLDKAEEEWRQAAVASPPFESNLVRAGSVLFGDAGSLVHAGVGSGGYVCSLSKSVSRLVLLVTLVPECVLEHIQNPVQHLSLAFPLGLWHHVNSEDITDWMARRDADGPRWKGQLQLPETRKKKKRTRAVSFSNKPKRTTRVTGRSALQRECNEIVDLCKSDEEPLILKRLRSKKAEIEGEGETTEEDKEKKETEDKESKKTEYKKESEVESRKPKRKAEQPRAVAQEPRSVVEATKTRKKVAELDATDTLKPGIHPAQKLIFTMGRIWEEGQYITLKNRSDDSLHLMLLMFVGVWVGKADKKAHTADKKPFAILWNGHTDNKKRIWRLPLTSLVAFDLHHQQLPSEFVFPPPIDVISEAQELMDATDNISQMPRVYFPGDNVRFSSSFFLSCFPTNSRGTGLRSTSSRPWVLEKSEERHEQAQMLEMDLATGGKN
jgi:hypothetical protein